MHILVLEGRLEEKEYLCNILKNTEMLSKIAFFYDSTEALGYLKKNRVDAIFIDIDIERTNRIYFAEFIKSYDHSVQIIFLSNNGNLAVKAFDINALDYIIKPFTLARLRKSLNRILAANYNDKKIHIQCLGKLQINGSSKTHTSIKWRTTKSKELFCFLLHNNNRSMSKEMLIEKLWPYLSEKDSTALLYTTIYHVRKTLSSIGSEIKLLRELGGYYLHLSEADIDVWRWERILNQFPTINMDNQEIVLEMVKKYRPYLEDEDYVWAESERVRIHNMWLNNTYKLIEFFVSNKWHEQAIQLCYDIQTIDSTEQKSHQFLLNIYNEIGDVDKAIKQYARLKKIEKQLIK